MKEFAKIMQLLSDPARLRILMVLTKKELCVCQLMGILGIPQPLVSRNLMLLSGAGFLQERKQGKLVFYSLNRGMDPLRKKIVSLLKDVLKSDTILAEDLRSLQDCERFQKKTGRCDMKTLLDFMKTRKKVR
ncbi:MAG: metalloregulator ArsR/SmtB family transcription factor [Nitrospiraceae bacterium]|nr:metalloregulator ArsR/SmtB family transcription factor [Nitrospiraceae bacterium]MDA8433546.1 metalloregulator ArsR/SmtB family transcription factor [Nitrospiraceae bacterium]